MDISFPITKKDFQIHKINGTINNIFLIESKSRFFLIDPGVSGDIKYVENYLDKIDLKAKDISLIIVSHMHPDHSGGAVEFRKKYKIPIAAHKRARYWYLGAGGYLQYKLDCYMTVQVAKRQKKKIGRVTFKRDINPEYLLEDNDCLPFFNDWEVIHVPGHTAHDMVIVNKKEKLIYAADEIVEIKNRFYLPMPVLFKKELKKSYEKLSNIEINTMLLAHGGPVFLNDSKIIYENMKKLIDEPPSNLARKVSYLSCYSPEIKKFINNIKSESRLN